MALARTSVYEQQYPVPFTVQDLRQEYEQIPKEIKYSIPLDSTMLSQLQARFAALSTRQPVQEPVVPDRATDQTWDPHSHEHASQSDAKSVPPAFQFDRFVFLLLCF